MEKIEIDIDQRFVDYLDNLLADNTAALAALRRGNTMRPGECSDMYRYVVPWIGEKTSKWTETVYYIVAGLYALNKTKSSDVAENFGGVVASMTRDDNRAAMEKRFQILITSHRDDVHIYLRQIIQMMKDVPINWVKLIKDLKSWNTDTQRVQRFWAKSFWSLIKKAPEESDKK
nr:type I-E CRISPR-associated protein Cse2/CasB [Candidatus Sigynarchaeota archaeon]